MFLVCTASTGTVCVAGKALRKPGISVLTARPWTVQEKLASKHKAALHRVEKQDVITAEKQGELNDAHKTIDSLNGNLDALISQIKCFELMRQQVKDRLDTEALPSAKVLALVTLKSQQPTMERKQASGPE
jgi:hypothetical protein